MPPKKATAGATAKKPAAAPTHGSYKEMIQGAILDLKERNGSSRAALKKYVQANNNGIESGAKFDSQFNRAVKSGVDQGIFAQPKGTSGPIKLAKKEAASKPATEKKPAAKKAAAKPKQATADKKAAPKKTATKTKVAKPAAKKATTTKKAATKPKSNTGAKRTKKAPAAAPAVVDEKMVLGKTKTGRVTKTKASAVNKPASKKTAKPKATTKKAAATPKKSETAAAA